MRQQLLTAVVEATRAAIVTLAPDARIVSWSATAEELYGYTAEYAIGRPYIDLIIPADRRRAALANFNVVLEGTPLDFETTHRRRDGRDADVAIAAVPLLGPDGSVVEVAAVIRNITRQKASERQLRASAEELRALAGEREEFLTMMAHEIRLPAAGIQLISDGLAKASGLTAAERQAVRDLRFQAHALAEMAETVLAIGRLDRGGQLDREELDVRELLRTASNRLMDQRVRCIPSPDPIIAVVDRDLMLHALTNLIANALRYSASPAPVTVSAAIAGAQLRICVADQGIGIAGEDIPRIFQKYARVTTGRAARVAGVGLGLYLVQLAAQAHGGTVAAQSLGPGAGSTFSMEIPVR